MTTGTVQANGIEMAYATVGDEAGTPLLLIAGLGVQLVGWDDGFVQGLADRGYRVIVYDNRDVGLSTHLHAAPRPNVSAALDGDAASASYLLGDMADDAAGLIDALSLDAVDVVGVSMGGMIAQGLAIRHPRRVRSLTLIMSTTGAPGVGESSPAALAVLLQAPPRDRHEIAERAVANARVTGSPGYPADHDAIRRRAARAYDRAVDPMGVGRQLVAVLASGDRTPALRDLDVPTVVVHGAADPLIDVSGGEALAKAIPGAELDVVDGLGHDLPQALWPRIFERIDQAVRRGGRRGG